MPTGCLTAAAPVPICATKGHPKRACLRVRIPPMAPRVTLSSNLSLPLVCTPGNKRENLATVRRK